jgi:hypothetical protein
MCGSLEFHLFLHISRPQKVDRHPRANGLQRPHLCMLCRYGIITNDSINQNITNNRIKIPLQKGALNVVITNPLWVVNSRIKMQGTTGKGAAAADRGVNIKGLISKCGHKSCHDLMIAGCKKVFIPHRRSGEDWHK